MNSENMSDDEKQNKIESKIDFNNVKSNFILKKIFNLIKRSKFLNFIKYNKRIQKRLNISLNSYEELALSPIEIELKIVKNKFGRFMNKAYKEKEKTDKYYLQEEKDEYYHIYFNNSKNEEKRYFLNKDEKVKTIKIIIDAPIKSLSRLDVNH